MEKNTPREGKHIKTNRKRRSRSKIIAVCAVALLLVLVISAAGFVSSKLGLLKYSDGKPSALYKAGLEDDEDELLDISGLLQVDPSEIPDIEVLTDDGVFNLLLLGTDDRELELTDGARADSTMLLSLDFNNKTGKLVSFERGMGVPIVDGKYKGMYDWLTHCFHWGGADLMVKEIRECFKVDVNHYVRVNLNALIKVIDAIGGIDVELTRIEALTLNYQATGGDYGQTTGDIYLGDRSSKLQGNLKEGTNHLTGVMAVAYSRLRSIDSDWHRIARQRKVIQACADALKSADLMTLNKLCNEVIPLVETNLTQMEILSLMIKAPGMMGVVLEQMSIPAEGTYGGMTAMTPRKERNMFWPDFAVNTQLLQDFLYGRHA